MPNSIGNIENPVPNSSIFTNTQGEGLFMLISSVLKIAGMIAGVFFVVQIILAGFAYMSANGDPKKTEAAWTKIWQSLIGIILVASAFVIASVVVYFLGINILNLSWTQK
jgi:succinate dehydrogenase/fumarate reductase cytochrome b subunit